MTLDEPYTFGALTWPAGASLVWDAAGHAIGGWLKDTVTIGALPISSDFTLYPSGKLHMVELAAKATVAGHEFPEFAKLELRETGTLAAARYISERGFMIHGEEWTDTTEATYDAAGHVVTTSTTHYQSDVRPPKFK